MALLNFRCPKCGAEKMTLSKKIPETPDCLVCQIPMERNQTGISANKKEKLDNGIMPKSIERFDNAEELFRERSRNSK